MRTNADLTLYNRYLVAGVETYQRTQIAAVAWENRKAANVLASGGNIASDQARVFVPLARGDNYLAPKAWQALEDKTENWTLQVGDVIVKGLVDDDVDAEFTMTALKAAYDDVLQITSVDTMDAGSAALQHWQIGAK